MERSPVDARLNILRPTHARLVVLVGLCAVTIIGYAHRNSIAVAEKIIREDLQLSKVQMGWVLSMFFLSYALLQIPTGWLGYHWGTRRALPLFAVVSSLCTAGLGFMDGFVGLLLARFGQGTAQAGFFPSATSSISRWFPRTQRAIISGALGSAMSIGGAGGVALTGLLLPSLGWRWVFALYALPGLAWALWFFWWFRDNPEDHRAVNAAELACIQGTESNLGPAQESASEESNQPTAKRSDAITDEVPRHVRAPEGILSKPVEKSPDLEWTQRRSDIPVPEPTPWLKMLTSPGLFWICGQQFFRAAGYMFFASWFATFLQETRDVSLMEAGLLNSLPLLGVVVGTLVGGVISDGVLKWKGSRWLARQGVAGSALLLCAGFVLLAKPVENPLLAVLLITAGSFTAAFAGPCAYASTMDMGGRHVAPVFATMNMCGNLGAFLFPIVVTFLLPFWDWDGVLLCFAGIYAASGCCWFLTNTDRPLFE